MKRNYAALLPIAVFLVFYLGAGIAFRDFYVMPAIVGFLIALFVAFLQNRALSFDEKVSVIARGLADENIITMCLIFLAAGAFSGIVSAAGGADSTVTLALHAVPPSFSVVGLFLIGCFISTAMGTSVGTVTVLVPFAVGIADRTGYSLALCLAACVSGAMFGDNLSMISDTTIAAVRTQGCGMKDKFKMNFFIVLPAAVVAAGIYLAVTLNSTPAPLELEPITGAMVLQVVPYLLVLVGALIGFNIFLVLIAGILASIVIGLATGMFAFSEIFNLMNSGITSMYDITVISIVVSCIGSLIKEGGGIQAVLELVKSHIKSAKSAQLGIAAIVAGVDIATANNTIAIVMSGSLAKEISTEYGIEPRRTASILDIFASVVQGLIPYGAQLLYASAGATALLASGSISSVEIIPYMYYPVLMAVSAILFIVFSRGKKK
ncbi:MAG TPA: Na+/H+ antiporter NhaC family protein [Firmicutes bacterium]|nr:Na+/H+ antiporter NhaC family protein [Bacillota bacterium]